MVMFLRRIDVDPTHGFYVGISTKLRQKIRQMTMRFPPSALPTQPLATVLLILHPEY